VKTAGGVNGHTHTPTNLTVLTLPHVVCLTSADISFISLFLCLYNVRSSSVHVTGQECAVSAFIEAHLHMQINNAVSVLDKSRASFLLQKYIYIQTHTHINEVSVLQY